MMISENDNDNDIDDDNDWWWRWWFRCSLSTQWFFVYLIPCQTEIWKCSFFEERGKPECPESNFLEQAQRERTHNKLNPHVALTLRFKHRPHLWEASASTIMPPLLPVVNLVCVWYRVRESCHFMPISEINASVFLSTSKTLTGEDFWTVYPSYMVQACHRSGKKVMKNHGIWRTQKTMNPVPSRQLFNS